MAVAAHVFGGVTGGCTQHSACDRTDDGTNGTNGRTDNRARDGTGAHTRVLAQVAAAAGVDVYIIVVVTHAVRRIAARCT
jgi:hypothetical protein